MSFLESPAQKKWKKPSQTRRRRTQQPSAVDGAAVALLFSELASPKKLPALAPSMRRRRLHQQPATAAHNSELAPPKKLPAPLAPSMRRQIQQLSTASNGAAAAATQRNTFRTKMQQKTICFSLGSPVSSISSVSLCSSTSSSDTARPEFRVRRPPTRLKSSATSKNDDDDALQDFAASFYQRGDTLFTKKNMASGIDKAMIKPLSKRRHHTMTTTDDGGAVKKKRSTLRTKNMHSDEPKNKEKTHVKTRKTRVADAALTNFDVAMAAAAAVAAKSKLGFLRKKEDAVVKLSQREHPDESSTLGSFSFDSQSFSSSPPCSPVAKKRNKGASAHYFSSSSESESNKVSSQDEALLSSAEPKKSHRATAKKDNTGVPNTLHFSSFSVSSKQSYLSQGEALLSNADPKKNHHATIGAKKRMKTASKLYISSSGAFDKLPKLDDYELLLSRVEPKKSERATKDRRTTTKGYISSSSVSDKQYKLQFLSNAESKLSKRAKGTLPSSSSSSSNSKQQNHEAAVKRKPEPEVIVIDDSDDDDAKKKMAVKAMCSTGTKPLPDYDDVEEVETLTCEQVIRRKFQQAKEQNLVINLE